jgi:hypothetical protein
MFWVVVQFFLAVATFVGWQLLKERRAAAADEKPSEKWYPDPWFD